MTQRRVRTVSRPRVTRPRRRVLLELELTDGRRFLVEIELTAAALNFGSDSKTGGKQRPFTMRRRSPHRGQSCTWMFSCTWAAHGQHMGTAIDSRAKRSRAPRRCAFVGRTIHLEWSAQRHRRVPATVAGTVRLFRNRNATGTHQHFLVQNRGNDASSSACGGIVVAAMRKGK